MIRLYRKTIEPLLYAIGYTVLLLFRAIGQSHQLYFKRREILEQMFIAGVGSLFVVSIVSVFTGMILGLNTGLGLRDFGAEGQIGLLLTITLTREMSPFMTSLILAASVGSAMAAEIGTMKVSEEIDALEVMSISPIRYLVMPRIVGFSLMVPVLCVYSAALGILGGGIVGHFQLGIDIISYFQDVYYRISSVPGLKDLYVGLLKGYVFGLSIATISCSQGLRTEGGAIGVGQTTRKAVVTSFLMVIFSGYVLTALFYK
ncbi:Membrane protein of an ABC transporter complex [Leptospira biflexa serovar Patoc strain 'Patoc 1 (Ames)']|uniref:ABC-type transport system, permease putative resistance to organic solvant putative membrane protein n=1 Tax=Leptospira biflexa serovar Patoc (strain Patoc 1 / ATCC 23582 / Paris) TaxID=456481 RepID=B0SS79_LEPBP|nr:ABC transporter permease [Leptospira biflexa]ABZ94317.1 Membrane protein of an ABC transporter complex [Leptospira biflexa serovar Patoc strain 'Patoc 1 (Ames)']ABZ97969.1 ABC-type transport system, permease; putative resistance to organic solvant; putative membrane protein [Leptospira biflexa serovar Patoc strain 'Patoc 1 (Paris)']